jgi:cytochrome oxidase assembly protein ShyY1
VYRFLLTPRWLGILALTLAASAVMVLLGNWQLHRYQQRATTNERIDSAQMRAPVPLTEVLPGAGTIAGTAGQPPPAEAAWTRVTATGRYDAANTFVIRSRTVDEQVGFEAVVPLILDDGTAVLVDRGWLPPARGAATVTVQVPAPPTGPVTVVGRVHLSESRPDPVSRRDGRLETRRIAVPQLAAELPYPVFGGYLLLDQQTPAADPAFSAIPAQHENDWQNAGYVVQWWIFAAMALFGYGWLARREARGPHDGAPRDDLAAPAPAPTPAPTAPA